MARLVGDLMFPSGKYIKNGEERTKWIKCGVLLETDKGMRVKIESIPLGVEAGGLWLSCFEPRDSSPAQPQASTGGFREPAPTQPPLDDDTPF